MELKYLNEFDQSFLTFLEKASRSPNEIKKYTRPITVNGSYGFEIKMSNGHNRQIYFIKNEKMITSVKGSSLAPILILPFLKNETFQIVYICEGESDGMALLEKNQNVIILPGANSSSCIGKNAKILTKCLNKKYDFRIIFDNDIAGNNGALKTYEELLKLFPDSKIKIFKWNKHLSKDVREILNLEKKETSFFDDFFTNEGKNKIIENLIPHFNELTPPLDYIHQTKTLFFTFINNNLNFIVTSNDKIEIANELNASFRQYIIPNYLDRYDLELFKQEIQNDLVDFEIFNDLFNFLKKYVVAPDEVLNLVIAYILLSYIYPIFTHIPYLYINGMKGSGKSTLANITTLLSFNGEHLSNPSLASFRRIVDGKRGLVSLDDIEILANDNSESQEFRSQLNSGYETKAKTTLCSGEKNNIQHIYLGCPKIFNSINGLENILSSRSIYLKMSPANNKKVSKINSSDSIFAQLRTRALFWGLKNHRSITKIASSISINSSRESDLILPLISIAYFFDNKNNSSQIFNSIISCYENNLILKGHIQTFENCFIEVLHETWCENNLREDFEVSNRVLLDKLLIFDNPCIPENSQRIRTYIGKAFNQLDLSKSCRRSYELNQRCTFYKVKTEILSSLFNKQSSTNSTGGYLSNNFNELASNKTT